MAVLRIVANAATDRPDSAIDFYRALFGLEVAMDLGWIAILAGDGCAAPQLGFAREGGSGTPVPDLSIEVDDVDAVHRIALARGEPVVYGPADEAWGVRRFYVRDPLGRILNVLSHRLAGSGQARE